VVSAILLFDALLLLSDRQVVVHLSAGSPGSVAYLAGPLVAGIYLSLVLIAVRLLWPAPSGSPYALVGLVGPLALMAGLVTFVLAALSWGTALALSATPGFFALSLLGISAPLLALKFPAPRRTPASFVALAASLLPVPIALIVGLPVQGEYGTLYLTSGALFLGAVLYQVAGALLSPDTATGPQVVARRLGRFLSLSFRIPHWARRGDSASAAPAGERPMLPAPTMPGRSRWPDVVSTGFGWLDVLLLGGLPRRGQATLWTYDGPGPDTVVAMTLNVALQRGEPVVVVTAASSVTEVAELMERLRPGFTEHDREGRVLWVDASGRRRSPGPSPISGPGDHVQLLRALRAASEEAGRRSPGGFCVGFLGLSSAIQAGGGVAFVRNAAAILRRYPALTLFSLAHLRPADPAVTTLLEATEGTLAFRTEGDRTFVRVLKLSPVETRGWVECRFQRTSDRRYQNSNEVVRPFAETPRSPVRSMLPSPPATSHRPGEGLAARLDPSPCAHPGLPFGEAPAGNPSTQRALEISRSGPT